MRQLGRIGLADLRPRIRFARVVTPLEWDRDLQIHLGATFNLSHSFRQMLHLRPRNRFEDLDGVYLVGGGTHPGSGLPVIFESAKISARLLLEELGLPTQWESAPRAQRHRNGSVPTHCEATGFIPEDELALNRMILHEELLS
jgi:phytoene desaturase